VYDEQQATELPRAYIKVREGIPQNDATVKELIHFVDSNVANHKKLRGGVRFLDEVPKSAAGKILRKELRIIASAEAQPKFNAKL
jgi:4-coumarate--CoA ligase